MKKRFKTKKKYKDLKIAFKKISKQQLQDIASDKVCQLLAYSRYFSPGTSTSSISTLIADMTEILLKETLKPQLNKQTCYRTNSIK